VTTAGLPLTAEALVETDGKFFVLDTTRLKTVWVKKPN